MQDHDIIDFAHELGQLRRVSHEGWKLLGMDHPDTVAEHSLRAAQIGYMLALMEGFDQPERVAAMLCFHDMAEARIGDIHKLANRYIVADEERAAREQTEKLGPVGERIFALWDETEERSTQAGIIAKDADYLEQAVTGKEYLEQGFERAQQWIDNVAKAVRTTSAKRLVAELATGHSNDWWNGLKRLEKNTG